MTNDTVNYSIRIDRDVREQMKEIPGMADDIRRFIERRINVHQEEASDDPIQYFVQRQLEKHGLIGAYCVYQLAGSVSDRHYEQNVERRFPDEEKANYIANRIKQELEEESVSGYEIGKVIEDILRETIHEDESQSPTRASYYDRFQNDAIKRIESPESDLEEQVFWTVLQLGKDRNIRHGNSVTDGGFRIERKSLSKTLEHGYDVSGNKIEQAIDGLVSVGAMRSYKDTNAYSYSQINIPEHLYDALETGLEEKERSVRSKVKEFTDDHWYLDSVQEITQDDDLEERYSQERYLYRNEQDAHDDRIQGDDELAELVSDLIQDGVVITKYSTGRRSTGGRSSTRSKLTYVLAPAVRQTIGDAIYMKQAVSE